MSFSVCTLTSISDSVSHANGASTYITSVHVAVKVLVDAVGVEVVRGYAEQRSGCVRIGLSIYKFPVQILQRKLKKFKVPRY